MSRKKSDWTLVTGIFFVVGLVVIGLMRFATYYRSDPQRSILGALFGAALVWGLAACILRRPACLRLPRKGGQLLCGLALRGLPRDCAERPQARRRTSSSCSPSRSP